MTGYELSKIWFKWCKTNRGLVNPNHHALYFWAIEKANSLEWCPCFGLPSDEAMHHLGINSYKTYIKAFDDLEQFGFIKVMERSKNQFTSNIIALVLFTEASTKANAKAKHKADTEALAKASPKQSDYNKTLKPLNLKTLKPLNKEEESEFSKNENYALLSENEFIKSELEKANEIIKSLEENQQPKPRKKVPPKKEGDPKPDLTEMCRAFYRENPNKYSDILYKEFLAYWTEKDQKGKERWHEQKFFDVSKRLATWQKKAIEYNQNKNHGTTSQISNSRSKNNWNAEQVALDAIAIATTHLN